jgi:serine/threonine protein kinase
MGKFGITILLNAGLGDGRFQELAVKLTAIDTTTTTTKELRIACELNDLHKDTPIFPHTYGWLVCDEIPRPWHRMLDMRQRNHPVVSPFREAPVLFMFMQAIRHKWSEIPLWVENRYRVCLFILIHGIWLASSRLGFIHQDIHPDQIMLQPSATGAMEESRFPFGDDREVRVLTAYTPCLLDYGFASTTRHQHTRFANNDVQEIEELFAMRFAEDAPKSKEAQSERDAFDLFRQTAVWRYARNAWGIHEPNTVLVPVLNDAFFEIPEIQRRTLEPATKRPALEIERCFTCFTSNVNHQIIHPTSGQKKYFCGPACYEAIHPICHFIK